MASWLTSHGSVKDPARRRRFLGLATSVACALAAVCATTAPAALNYSDQDTIPVSGEPGSIAIDQSSGDLYVATSSPDRIARFDSAGQPAPFSDGGDPEKPYISGNALKGVPGESFAFDYNGLTQVAVDNSGGPSAGDIYVTDTYAEKLVVFSRSGTYRGQLDLGAAGPETGGYPCGVAVDALGAVYVSYASAQHIDAFMPSGPDPSEAQFLGQFSSVQSNYNCGLAVAEKGILYAGTFPTAWLKRYSLTDLGSANAPATEVDPSVTAFAVNPADESLFVDKGDRVKIYSAGGDPGLVFGQSAISNSRGIAVNASGGHVFASTEGGKVVDFGLVTVPDVTTEGATTADEVTSASATLTATVDTAGAGPVTGCSFEYGLTDSYGQSVPCAQAPPFTSQTQVSAEITGLSRARKFHYRVTASNAQGSSDGNDRTFNTRGNLTPTGGSPYAVGTRPYKVTTADLDGDGNLDLVTGNLESNDVSVLLGDGSGNFSAAPGSPYAAGSGSGAAAIGDLDNDGDPDLAVVDNGDFDVRVLLNDGSGVFAPDPAGPFPVGTAPYPAQIGDVDGDGNPDLVVPNFNSSDITVLLGDGAGGFEPAPDSPFSVGPNPDSVALGDLDGDGDPDIAAGDNQLTVLLGDGLGGFSPAPGSTLPGGEFSGFSVSISDLNGDGHPDLGAVGHQNSTNSRGVLALLGDGSGGFELPQVTFLPGSESLNGVSFGDLDGDGVPDAVFLDSIGGKIDVMIGDGTGGFDPVAENPYEVGAFPTTVAIGDFDGDLKPDVAVANFTDGSVSVLINGFGPPVPLPRASTGVATGISKTDATLHANVDPAGNGVVTDCSFEYGASNSYGQTAPCSPVPPYASSTAVSAAISGLGAATTYHYRVAATNANGVRRSHDRTFTTASAVTGLTTEPATNVESDGATLNGSFVGDGQETVYHFEYGTSSYDNTTPTASAGSTVGLTPISAEINGLESSTTYHFRVVAENAEGQTLGSDEVFTTPARAQLEASTDAVIYAGRTEAFVSGRAYPSVAGDITDCSFEFGASASYGQIVPCEPSPPYSTPTSVYGSLSGLTPETVYHYRVVVSNGVETAAGGDETLTTVSAGPTVQTFPASEVGEISALFNGYFEGTGEETSYYFEYGTTTAYGSYTTPPPGTNAGAPFGFQFVSAGPGDVLHPNTTYHYRIVATNPQGTSHGNDETFTTPGVDLDGNTGLPSAITATSATVSGDVDPLEGGPIVDCHFEYGTTIAVEQSIPCDQATPYSSPTVVTAHLSGLQPGTFYFYRLAASNGHSAIVRGRHGFQTLSAIDSTSQSVSAGGTVSTNSTTSEGDPTGTSVTTPVAGTVSIEEGPVSGSEPSGFTYSGQQVQITAPVASVANPLVIHFLVDASLLPPGTDETNLQVFRNGTLVAACSPESGSSAIPNPCVAARNATGGGGVELVIRTSAASTWNFGVRNRPETTVTSGPSGPTKDATPTFVFSSSASGSTFQCSLDSEAFRPCSGPGSKDTPASALADGPHKFEVRATDKFGGADLSPASAAFSVDTHVPETTIDSGPSGPTTNPSPTFAFSSDEGGAAFECNLDSAGYVPCSSPEALSGLSEGSHSFKARAKDAAGNVDKTPASTTFNLDSVAPETTINSGPSGPTKDASPTFAFSSSESGSTFQCRIDGEKFRPCSGPGAKDTLATLSDEFHGFEVRAIDKAGNVDPSAAGIGFTVDTHVPETTIDSGPSGFTVENPPAFAFSSDEPAATLECSLDSGAYAVCTSPRTLSGLADGAHTFKVRARDAAGNLDSSAAVAKFTLDTVTPDTTITTAPAAATKDATPTIVFSSTESGSTFQCRIDGEGFRPCSGPGSKDTPASALADGPHSFEVRAIDKAGNTDATPASASFTVDTHVPETTIDSGPSGNITDPSPTFAFSSDEPAAALECSLDSAAYAVCTSPRQVGPLAKGAHTFKIRAKDAAGNVDSTPATAKFTLK